MSWWWKAVGDPRLRIDRASSGGQRRGVIVSGSASPGPGAVRVIASSDSFTSIFTPPTSCRAGGRSPLFRRAGASAARADRRLASELLTWWPRLAENTVSKVTGRARKGDRCYAEGRGGVARGLRVQQSSQNALAIVRSFRQRAMSRVLSLADDRRALLHWSSWDYPRVVRARARRREGERIANLEEAQAADPALFGSSILFSSMPSPHAVRSTQRIPIASSSASTGL